MKIAVCDDMSDQRARLVLMLKEYLGWRGVGAAVLEYDSGEALLAAFSPHAFDLVLLDIYMKALDGVETARRIKSAEPDCPVIFTTSSAEHGADAYDVEALYYLVKPLERDKLFHVLDKWYDRIPALHTVSVKTGRSQREIALAEILYVEVQGRSSTVHTLTETVESSMPLSAIEALLPEKDFCRVIRYCVVALGQIRSVGDVSLTLSNGQVLPLSRRERETVKEKLAAFRLRQLRRR